MDGAVGGQTAAGIVSLLALRKQIHEAIDDHIARPGIEGQDLVDCASSGQPGDIANPADVLDGPRFCRMAEEYKIAVGDKRRTLTARGEIGGTEIGDGCDPGALGDDGRFANLQRGRNGGSAETTALWIMPDGLAVRSDQIDRTRRNAMFAAGSEEGLGKESADEKVHEANIRS